MHEKPYTDDSGNSHYRCELCGGLFPWDEVARHVNQYHRVSPGETERYYGDGQVVGA